MIALKVRGPNNPTPVSLTVDAAISFSALRILIQEALGLEEGKDSEDSSSSACKYNLLTGFPPRILELNEESIQGHIQNNDVILIRSLLKRHHVFGIGGV